MELIVVQLILQDHHLHHSDGHGKCKPEQMDKGEELVLFQISIGYLQVGPQHTHYIMRGKAAIFIPKNKTLIINVLAKRRQAD